jgi:hypothetical protein
MAAATLEIIKETRLNEGYTNPTNFPVSTYRGKQVTVLTRAKTTSLVVFHNLMEPISLWVSNEELS